MARVLPSYRYRRRNLDWPAIRCRVPGTTRHSRTPRHSVRAFLSPNAVYFTTTLVVSAMLLVPSLPANVIGALLCTGAIGSLGYLVYTRAHEHWRRNKL